MLLHPTWITKGHPKVSIDKTKLFSPLASKLTVLCSSINDMLIHLFVQSRTPRVTFDSFFSLTPHPTTNRESCQFSFFDVSQFCAISTAIKFKPLSSLAFPANWFPFLHPDPLQISLHSRARAISLKNKSNLPALLQTLLLLLLLSGYSSLTSELLLSLSASSITSLHL